MSFRVYCSIPTHTSGRDEILMEVVEMTTEFSKKFPYKENIEMDYLAPGEVYDPNCVGDANVVLLMHQNNKFDFDKDTISRDTLRDFMLAEELGKKVFLLYRTKDGKLFTYSIESKSSNYIRGIAGTTDYFNTFMRNNIYDRKPKVDYSLVPPYPIPAPQPVQTKYIKTIGIVKPIHDRRLLI